MAHGMHANRMKVFGANHPEELLEYRPFLYCIDHQLICHAIKLFLRANYGANKEQVCIEYNGLYIYIDV